MKAIKFYEKHAPYVWLVSFVITFFIYSYIATR